MLKNSARNCSVVDSVIFVSFMTEKSRFHQPGPVNVSRPKLPGVGSTALPSTGLVTVGRPKNPSPRPLLLPITAVEKNWVPPPGLKVGFCSKKGLAPTPFQSSRPYCRVPKGPTTVNGLPDWAVKIPSIFQP